MNETKGKNEESANPRGIDMMKTSRTESVNLDRFMETMARVLGIPRKKLDKLMFQGQAHPTFRRHSTAQRSRSRSSSLAVK
jgi:hypothetical protein